MTTSKPEQDLSSIFGKLSQCQNLKAEEAEFAAHQIFIDLANNAPNTLTRLTALFGGLTIKKPTIDELVGMARAMEATRQFRFSFNVDKPLVTAGGTGGDTLQTINVTTPAILVASSAGAYALKSGAKAFSSKTGSSDLADALGINVHASRDVVQACVEKIRTTVWASEGVYPWMNPLIQLGSCSSTKDIMPLLYSLRLVIATALNPFSTKRQVRGVSKPFTETVAQVLSKCGYEKALVTIGYGRTEETKIDEVSSLGKTVVSEVKPNGSVDTYHFYPEDIGAKRGKPADIVTAQTHMENAKIAAEILSGKDKTSRRTLILVNAAAILYTADETKDLKDGYELAEQAIDEGKAKEKLEALVTLSGGHREKLAPLINTDFS